MAKECSYCRRAPTGIEGHEGLFIIDMSPGPDYKVGTPIFKCSACGGMWCRQYEGSGTFQWRQIGF